MGLISALTIAQSSINAISTQASVVSSNIAGANDSTYSRQIANLSTMVGGGVDVESITGAANQALFDATLSANSSAATQSAISSGLNQLDQTVNSSNDQTPSIMLGNLTDALQQYATSPSNQTSAQAVLTSAQALTSTLNEDTTTVQQVREQADAGIAASVSSINSLLSQFQTINSAIVADSSSSSTADMANDLDQRNSILTQLSQQIGISVVTRPNNDDVIYTDSGVTLFDQTARTVSFTPTTTYTAQTTGNPVYVDGVPITGSSAIMPISSGNLAGLANLRDTLAPTYQSQLDQIAGGLISDFAETDQSNPPTLPEVPGLFTYSGAPAMPGTSVVPGLAGEISVSPNVDPTQGGNLNLIRDGGISDPSNPAYDYNTTGAAGFSDRIQQLINNLDTAQSFDPTAGAGSSATLTDYVTNSVSWLEGQRQTATNQSTYQQTLVSQANQALSGATGVNIDDEMSQMLDLENSYQASAKLISTVNDMYTDLFSSLWASG